MFPKSVAIYLQSHTVLKRSMKRFVGEVTQEQGLLFPCNEYSLVSSEKNEEQNEEYNFTIIGMDLESEYLIKNILLPWYKCEMKKSCPVLSVNKTLAEKSYVSLGLLINRENISCFSNLKNYFTIKSNFSKTKLQMCRNN